MRRFKFKFEVILNQRKGKEDNALAALGAAQRNYQMEISKKSKLMSDLSAALERRELLANGTVDIGAYKLEQDFIVGTKQRMIQQDQAIVRASKVVEKSLRAYLHARRQTRTIELIREKSYQEFRREQNKREQKELDDLMIMRNRMKDLEDLAS